MNPAVGQSVIVPVIIQRNHFVAHDPQQIVSIAAILDALDRLMEGRTTFIVAHRLSTLRKAHRVLVLDHGRLVESGAPADLLAAGGLYRTLHDLQGGAPVAAGPVASAEVTAAEGADVEVTDVVAADAVPADAATPVVTSVDRPVGPPAPGAAWMPPPPPSWRARPLATSTQGGSPDVR